MTMKLKNHPYAQCHVEIRNNSVEFVSYSTSVIEINNNWLRCSGLYSMTTRKQIGWFLKEYAPMISYQMVRACYAGDMQINIATGEIVPL